MFNMNNMLTRKLLSIGLLFIGTCSVQAQRALGNSGQLMIPTADMEQAATFRGGANVTQPDLISKDINYYSGNYFVALTPFKWLEVTFRETLFRGKFKHGFHEQERSGGIRLRPLEEKETKWWPSLAIGTHDLIRNKGGWTPLQGYYVVATKHIGNERIGRFGLTIGYFNHLKDQNKIMEHTFKNGVFGGVTYAMPHAENVQVMAEWDTVGMNVGAHALLWRHLGVQIFTRDFKGVNGGLYYSYTIPY